MRVDLILELVAGVDEVGRGAWFGPVVAAAVILPLTEFKEFRQLGIRDSKKLSIKAREELAIEIKSKAIGWAVGSASVTEIDRINILEASLLAMERAIGGLQVMPHYCLIDGRIPLRWRELAPLPQMVIIGGDDLSLAIGAASIVAKVWRDELIVGMAESFPGYDLAKNKGYGTKRHRLGVEMWGLTDQHRRSFRISNLSPSVSKMG